MNALGDRPWAHEHIKHVVKWADPHPELLVGFASDGGGRVVVVQQSGRRLDQHAVRVAVDIHRKSELPRQQHHTPCVVVEQDGCAVAPVVGFPLLGHPLAVVALVIKSRASQHMPTLRRQLNVADHNTLVAGEVATCLVEPRSSPVVGQIDTGSSLGGRRGHGFLSLVRVAVRR